MDATKEKIVRKPHPYERANFLSKMFFCWLLPFFARGLKAEVTEDNMYATPKDQMSSELGQKLEAEWKKEQLTKKEPSLLFAIFKVFKVELIVYGIFQLFFEFIEIVQPLLVAKLISFYEPGAIINDPNEPYIYAGLIVLIIFISVFMLHMFQLKIMALGMKIRIAVCALIYRKALKLSKSSLAETTIGQMVNLLSNDVGRFDFAAQHIHNLWLAPLECVIVMWLLYVYVGFTGLVGTLFLLAFIPFQMYMAKCTSRFRLKTAMRTDERVRLMNEIVTGIQVIKMYTWEKPFAKLAELARWTEMKQIRGTSTIRAIMMSLSLILNRVAIYLCILTYVYTGNVVTASYAFTVSSFYGVLRYVVTMSFPYAILQFAETRVSISRIKKFLLYEEIKLIDNRSYSFISNGFNSTENFKKPQLKPKEVGVCMENVSAKWLNTSPDHNLENITFNVKSNQLVAVVGPVGGGKTTLMHTILRELPPQEGHMEVEGRMSYVSQEPWVFGGTVRQNIIFGQEFVRKKYDEVIRVCALERDFTLFPHGDQTLVGERGVALSGGQRARINLARAIYKDADIYLLDDPLSAVDTHVGKKLFINCICGYLKEKCVVLVTHQLQYLRNVHCIYLLEDGKISASGTYQQMKSSGSKFTKLLAESKEEEKRLEEEFKRKSSMKDIASMEQQEEAPVQEKEYRESGKISYRVYISYLQAGGNWFITGLLFLAFIGSQVLGSCTDYFITIWVNMNQQMTENSIKVPHNDTSNSNFDIFNNATEPENTWWWENIVNEDNALISYSCLLLLTTVLTIARALGFFRYCMRASQRLHNAMFDRIVFSPMRFFNTNPTGRILNRFSKDVGAVDETLPLTLMDTIQIGLTVLAVTLVVGSVTPWVLIPTFVIVVIFYFLRVGFLASSRNIKRVEAITRSPIYTHLTASLQGLTTIRAFGAEEILTEEFDYFQDEYTAAYFLFLTANRTFGYWLDFHCVIYTALVIISILFIQNESFGGNVGLALTQSMSLTGMFQWGMRQWSELENQMTSVERMKEYAELPAEKEIDCRDPPKGWPSRGALEFRNMSLRYSPDDPYVLKNLIFQIKPREKVGIVGRTGAGKSSLIQALFRLADIDGQILIDNVDTKTLSLNKLRSNISIIPQEPVLFSGTLRKNLDPFDDHSDEVLWNALEEVELKHAVDDLPAGLDSKMAEGGSNFSVGQRQLVCLARAIIRKNKVLILDEATANVDPQTDALIQTTIRNKFSDCTVLTIAHRLHTIMDSDKVLVMDAGKAVEFDHPHVLLQNPGGAFFKLVQQTGSGMAEILTKISSDNYMNNFLNQLKSRSSYYEN